MDVNLLLIGFDKFNSEYSSIEEGILKELNDVKIQRFLKIQNNTIQEHAGSHVEYRIHYHIIEVSPAVQIYLHNLMSYVARDVDINLSSVRVINPYEITEELKSLFRFVSKKSEIPVPNDRDLILVLLNGQLDSRSRYGFSTEFSYSEEQKMIDEIFREGSEFAIGEFIFPLTEPLTYNDDYGTADESNDNAFAAKSEMSTKIEVETHCIQDWKAVSLEWAIERNIALQSRVKKGKRSSAERTQHHLTLLRDVYNKKEMKRILVQMKQLLNNELMMNDELTNMIEGTYVVSDFFFLQNFYFYDCTAGPFEWGKIDEVANIRTKTSLINAREFAPELQYYTSVTESLLDFARFVAHQIQLACTQPGYSDKRSECERDSSRVVEAQKTIQGDTMKNAAKLSQLYRDLQTIEKKYRSITQHTRSVQLKDREMELTIRLSRILSDVMAHAITPPMVLHERDASATLSPFSATPYYFSFVPPTTRLDSRTELLREMNKAVAPVAKTKERIHFQVNYLTRNGYEDFFSMDNNFFDYSVFRSEMERLKLPSQEFFFSFQEYRLEKEPRLQTAILRSLSSAIVPHLSTKRTIFPVQQPYLNTTVLFQLLRSSNGVVSGHDIQIYILCMTDTARRPVLLDKNQQVVVRSDAFNHIVFAVQNERASSSSPYYFNTIPMYYNLHNIMSPLLSRVFELLSDTQLNLYIGEKVQTNVSPLVEDCIQRAVGSVDPAFSPNSVFSTFHLQIMSQGRLITQIQTAIDAFNELIVGV